MYQIIYYSTASLDVTKDNITEILLKSRRFNEKNAITGCLLYHDGIFLQILEGEEKTVKALYSKIEKDERHANAKLLVVEKTEERTFNSWSMAYRELGEEEMNEIGNKLFKQEFNNLLEVVENPTHVTRMFWYMAKEFVK